MTKQIDTKKSRRQRYPPEYKQEVLALAEKIGEKSATKELGLHESRLYGWRTKAKAMPLRVNLGPQADDYVADIFGSRYAVIDRVERLPRLFMALTK